MATLTVGTGEGNFTTIQAALNAAKDGDTIVISAGTYDEVVNFPRTKAMSNVTIMAATPETVTWKGGIVADWKSGENCLRTNITISGIDFVLKPNADGSGTIISVRESINWTIENCSFTKYDENGDVDFAGHSWNPISFPTKANRNYGLTITGCEFNGGSCALRVGQNTATGYGLKVSGCTINNTNFNLQGGGAYDAIFANNTVVIDYDLGRDGKDAAFIVGKSDVTDARITITGGSITMEGDADPKNDQGWSAITLTKNFAGSIDISGVAITNTTSHSFISDFTNKPSVSADLTGNTFYGADGVAGSAEEIEEILNIKNGNVSITYSDGTYSGMIETHAKLYVDNTYTSETPGFGVYAFNSFVAALKKVAPGVMGIHVANNITEDIPAEDLTIALSNDLTISGAVVTLNNGGYKFLTFAAAEKDSDIYINFTDVDLVAPRTQLSFGAYGEPENGVKVEIGANSLVSAYISVIREGSVVNVLKDGKFFSTGEVMRVEGILNAAGAADFKANTATLTADKRQVVAHYMWNYGNVALTNTYATVYSQLRLIGSEAELTLDNTRLENGVKVAGGWMENPVANGVGWIKTDGDITLINNSVLISNGATGANGYGLTVTETGAFNVASGSYAEFSAGVSNAGAITVNSGTFKVGTLFSGVGTQAPSTDLVNNGTFTVSGTSTLDIATVTGNAIKLADGAVVKDSTIGGTVALQGTAEFKGINSVGTLSVSGYNHKLIIGPKASLTANTGRTTLSYGSVIDVDGEIADAKKADKATLVKSLDIIGGFSFNGDGTYNGQDATLDVDNAYVSFGSSTSKNSGATGNFVFDFNNSIVDFTADFQTAASTAAGLTPKFQLNITNSVFNVGTRFAFSHENSVAVVDNSVVAITNQFKNVGKFTLQNNSQMTVGGNADGPSYEKTGNFGTLEVTSGSVFDMTTAATKGSPFYNAGTVVVNNATFEADYITNAAGGVISITGTSVVDGAITNNGTVKISGTTSTDLNVTGNAVEVAATLSDSTITGANANVFVNGASTFDGAVTFSGVTKVANGATLTIAAGANFKSANIAAGNDTYFGFGENADDAKGGIIDIYGNVTVNQTNADGAGVVKVNAGATLNSAEVCIENGGIADAIAGEMNIAGTLKTASLRIFSGASVNVTNGGSIIADHADNVSSLENISIWGGGALNINGGTVSVAESMGVGAESSVAVTNGNFSVVHTLTNNGTITVSGTSTVNVGSLTGNRVNVADDATLVSSNIGGSINMLGDLTIENGLTLSGGLWASNGGTLSGGTLNAYYAMFQKSTYAINADLELDYGYLSYGGTFTVSSTIHTKGTSGEVLYIRGDVDLLANAKLDCDKGLYIDYNGASLNVLAGATVDTTGITLTVANTELNIHYGSTVTAGFVTNTSGTINFTVTGEAAKTYMGGLVIDASAASNYGSVNVNVEGRDGFVSFVKDNDLYVADTKTIYVDTAWAGLAEGTMITDGLYFGVNAFASLTDITALTEGDRTISYTYSGTDAAGLRFTVSGTNVQFECDGRYYSFQSGSNELEFNFADDGSRNVVFDFIGGDYDITVTPVKAHTAEDLETTTPDAAGNLTAAVDKILVDDVTGAKVFNFSVADGLVQNMTFDYTIFEGNGTFTLYAVNADGSTTKLAMRRIGGQGGSFSINYLRAGNYKAEFTGYGYNPEVEFKGNFTFESVPVEELNNYKNNAELYGVGTTEANSVGVGDFIDWFKFTPAANATYNFDFALLEGGNNISATLIGVDANGREITLGLFGLREIPGVDGASLSSAFSVDASIAEVYVKIIGSSTDITSNYTFAINPVA